MTHPKTLIIFVVLIVAIFAVPAIADSATGFQIHEVRQGGAVRLWGDRSGQPLASCSSPLALHEMALIRDASAHTSIVTCEAYAGGTLRAFNLDR